MMMKIRQGVITGMIVLALLCTIGIAAAQADPGAGLQATAGEDDIAAYTGPIGAGNPLYGLKIAMEDLDETFTFNETLRVEKQLGHARLRIAEVRRELEINRTDTAQQALELYLQKVNLTGNSLAPYRSNASGLLHAQEMITKHQAVLEGLLLSHPNNTGLMRSYNNSLALEQKFEQKTAVRLERIIEKNNRTILKAVRLEIQERDRTGAGDGAQVETEAQVRAEQRQQGRVEQQDQALQPKKETSVPTTITTQPTRTQASPAVAAIRQEDRTPSDGQENNNGRGTADDAGRGNSRNT
jgi:hypothetical protein